MKAAACLAPPGRRTASRVQKALIVLVVLLFGASWSGVSPAPSEAAVTSVFDGKVPCTVEPDGVRFCGGADTAVETFDGVPIDVNVALPPEPAGGQDGDYPLMMMFHGWGGSEAPLNDMRLFVDRGYAVFSMSDRGWGGSCGGQGAKTGACAEGYNRLMDTRYEVRDAQLFAGILVDEGIADPDRIGAYGSSYGGGISMSLAALRNRMAMPGERPDRSLDLVPWESPGGVPISLAGAAPDIPWTDLAYSLVPNGRTLDYVADAPYALDPDNPVPGVMKLSFVTGLFAIGLGTSNYAVPGTDADADFLSWYTSIALGEPYEANPVVLDALEELTLHHSSYYIDDTVGPAPMLISSGTTDDIFPPSEALRFYNRTRTRHPDAPISLLFSDVGHQRAQNKQGDRDFLLDRRLEWLDHYVKGDGVKPVGGVMLTPQTCPADAPSSPTLTADTWRELKPGEVRFSADDSQSILPGEGLPLLPTTVPPLSAGTVQDLLGGIAYDPILGTVVAEGACSAPPDPTGTVTDPISGPVYEFAVEDPGFMMAGSPTVVADISSVAGSTPPHLSQIASRLIDVAPDGSETLVSRGLYRPDLATAPSRQVFQLQPNGWRFDPGHSVRLELLPFDLPYSRFSTGQLPITVENIELRLPSNDPPNGRQIKAPAPPVIPAGYEPAIDYVDEPFKPEPPVKPHAPADCRQPARGTRGSDSFTGGPGSDGYRGRGGADGLRGVGGSDCLWGEADADELAGAGGDDSIKGGRGADEIRAGSGNDRIAGGDGGDAIRGGNGDDRIKVNGGGRDLVRCGGGTDTVKAGSRDRVLGGCEKVRTKSSR